jgi:hypothetical protein
MSEGDHAFGRRTVVKLTGSALVGGAALSGAAAATADDHTVLQFETYFQDGIEDCDSIYAEHDAAGFAVEFDQPVDLPNSDELLELLKRALPDGIEFPFDDLAAADVDSESSTTYTVWAWDDDVGVFDVPRVGVGYTTEYGSSLADAQDNVIKYFDGVHISAAGVDG